MKTLTTKSFSQLSMMKAPLVRFAFGCACLGLTACASIVSKSQYPVTISSNPPGANFTIKKSNGMFVSQGVTPNTVTLRSSFGYFQPAKYIIDFTHKGVTQSIPLEANINGWYFGNLIIPFGIIPGMLIIDPLTGAMWRLDDTAIANFNCK
ncbi:MAG: hypothetical protein K2W97_06750 [Chthoniobacterales bacterium]|nr:hypothetical protein [Chthoniobacterales bacterium]